MQVKYKKMVVFMKRIEKLREKALNPVFGYDYWYLLFFRKFSSNEELGEFEYRYADAFTYAYDNMPISVDEGELIVGKTDYLMNDKEKSEWELLKTVADSIAPMVGQDSHMAPDYELVLRTGLNGIIDDVDKKYSDSGKLFYYLCRECLKAVVSFSNRYSDFIDSLPVSEERRKISDICRKVPANPAESFHEAIQSVHFIAFCLSINPCRYFAHQQFQLGHPDRYLYPYYENDIKNGVITKEYAQLLLDCLGIQINNRVASGLSSGYMVGGRYLDGSVVGNDLTEMCMQVVDDIRLVYPSVGLCYTTETDEKYLDKACEILSHGRSHPAIFNEDIISNGLQKYGVPEKESHNYIHSTCVEITPEASSNVWVASPYINLPSMLLKAIDREYENINELLDNVLIYLDREIAYGYHNQMKYREMRKKMTVNPLLSCLVNDCLENGVDIEHGGARYNWVMPSFVGMANLIDSLAVIEKLVFEEKKYKLTEVMEICNRNFEGAENVRLEFLNSVPKYGNDDDYADKWGRIVTEHIVSECNKFEYCFSEGRMIPSVFCWIMHERFGTQTGATPDGRKAGFPLGDGSGAAQGREKNGPTSSIISSTKWNHDDFIGGVAVNMKFSKKLFSNDGISNLKSLIKTYIARGGFEMQINVVDEEILFDARENPEKYSDLVVRIGGYSDYFVRLSPEMQSEVILRTVHEI